MKEENMLSENANSNNANRRTAIIFLGLFSLLIMLVVLIILMIVLIVVISTKKDQEERKTSGMFTYQYLKTDSSLKTTNSGITMLNEEISGFISREDNKGNYHLISNFGSGEYKCTGSCYCGDELERRTSAAIIRPVKYLVAAVSSVVAYGIAKKHFKNECERIIRDDSPTCSDVVTSIDDCDGDDEMSEEDKAIDDFMWHDEDLGKVLQAFVNGKVQGVYFRLSTKEEAIRIGEITGFVRNLKDGRVEVFAESNKKEKLDELLEYLHQGPDGAIVDKVEHKFFFDSPKFVVFGIINE